MIGTGEDKAIDLRVRGLHVDTRLKEFTLVAPHDITDPLFLVRRASRVNDNLPEESAQTPALALAAWRVAAGRSRDRAHLADPLARV